MWQGRALVGLKSQQETINSKKHEKRVKK